MECSSMVNHFPNSHRALGLTPELHNFDHLFLKQRSSVCAGIKGMGQPTWPLMIHYLPILVTVTNISSFYCLSTLWAKWYKQWLQIVHVDVVIDETAGMRSWCGWQCEAVSRGKGSGFYMKLFIVLFPVLFIHQYKALFIEYVLCSQELAWSHLSLFR